MNNFTFFYLHLLILAIDQMFLYLDKTEKTSKKFTSPSLDKYVKPEKPPTEQKKAVLASDFFGTGVVHQSEKKTPSYQHKKVKYTSVIF